MKAMLDITVDDDNFLDNARLQWTVSGAGDNPLEFDRFYPDAKVAIEFQGRQHYEEVTFRHGKSDLEQQQNRDGLKALACLRQKVTLVEIPDIDLSHETLVAKLGGVLPLLPPRTDRPLFRTLADYAMSVQIGRWPCAGKVKIARTTATDRGAKPLRPTIRLRRPSGFCRSIRRELATATT